MLNLALNFSLSTFILILMTLIIPGIQMEHPLTLVPTAFILGFVNFLIRPLLTLMGMDVTVPRIGLFSFVINWFFFNVGIGLLDDFDEKSWLGAFFGAVLMGLIQAILYRVDLNRRKPII